MYYKKHPTYKVRSGTFLILATKAPPKKSEIEKLRRSLLADGTHERGTALGVFKRAPAQSIVGLIKFSDSYLGDTGNPWENPGSHHWVVSEAECFDTPIPDIPGCQSLYRFVKSLPPDARQRILDRGFSDDMRILHMHQPWAMALVLGLKSIENRSTGLVTEERERDWAERLANEDL